MRAPGLVAGTVFAGYRIERLLGRGGMGEVYAAAHPRLPRTVALKLLNREVYADEEVRRRFDREAELAAALDHPNIVSVLDRGADGGLLWISMQYVDGSDAAAFAGRPLDPLRAVRIVEQCAEALDYAHERGVLHRDVKPANILLTAGRDGDRVLLSDFGIARLRDDELQLTRTGEFRATLAYAAPEQLSGQPVDHRVDQYSLGATLFTLLVGETPFTVASPGEMVAAHLTRPVPRASRLVAELPPAVDAVIAKAMAKNPSERYDSCIEFAQAARLALTGSASIPSVAPRPTGPMEPYRLPHNPIPPRPGQVSSGWRTISILLIVLALVAVAGVGAAGIYWKFLRPAGTKPVPWGEHNSIARHFPQLIPSSPAGTGWRDAQCWAAGTVVAQAGDPVPVRQIVCKDPDGVTSWYTEYVGRADAATYLDAHAVRVGDRESSERVGLLALYRPTNPAAPFSLATCGGTRPGVNNIVVEVHWPERSFEEVRDQWWQLAPF
ncbi:serine/threonine protein kinase [Nocardia otitidiscaviarum]|uniref:non-specific serine/threonine protein kinase n=1 Tax=Nocardia otitidiscaviarum TaxID=1823 RepID=A0A516NSD1_9NOCA|nr:serine/threonine-protein kinase [Nocardia otitidiscaviarum]MCP9621055.1 serine/threonine protein kinase [Nocardia otitidiscaviarum]QDP81816.1 serine/threonine protein kinase [Nocardia otitidiscaviarum]